MGERARCLHRRIALGGEVGGRALDTLSLRIHCHGVYPTGHRLAGQRCRNRRPIAQVEHGLIVVRDNGRVHVDPRSTSCPDCGTVRNFAGGVPEELGGSSMRHAA